MDEPVEATSSAAVGGQVALMAVEEEFVPRAPVEISEQKDEAKPLDASQADDVVVISHTPPSATQKRAKLQELIQHINKIKADRDGNLSLMIRMHEYVAMCQSIKPQCMDRNPI